MRSNMKTTKAFIFGATVAAAFVTTQNLQATNLADASALASASVHRLIVASPHGLEEFPWLLREASPRTETKAGSQTVLSAIRKNHALAASPRMREEFPELARTGGASTGVSSKPAALFGAPDHVLKNRALATSPRMKEEFPSLARGYAPQPAEKPLQVAPLK